ncbi:sulfite exporter TauE/SafE family protein [Neobacillus ginsengisoli]|uniref:Probable membrane transporter protein n=1 Tax=Neobacillus ginsengisoli TaxID=904295 RepID=A0ABT9XXD4_9BACI|nr:sulfite exporter TauE/SafE family protein [Neobacillus ginsengisoli]MDQ0200230.1 putative membrane protein YfcA [Neobacillus ginsengisoli]
MSIGIAVMGLFIGFLVGLTGVGGAALLTPILIMSGIHPSIAVGTDLVYNSITKLFGVFQHWKQKTINFKLAKYLAIGSVPSATVPIIILQFFEFSNHNQEQIIKQSLGYVLILVAIAILIRTFFDKKIRPNRWQLKSVEEKRGLTIFIGAVFGFIVGLTSIGSGSLFALAMLYLYRLSASELVGTDIAHAFLLVTVAGLLHANAGSVNYVLVGNLLIGSIPGVLLGSTLSAKVPTKLLRIVVAAIIIISGIKLIG